MRVLRVAFILMMSSFAGICMAGPVNSSASYPVAYANPSGDWLAIGDRKALLSWSDRGKTYSTAFVWPQKPDELERFSGGVAMRSFYPKTAPAAIACSPAASFVLSHRTSAGSAAGQWLEWSLPADLAAQRRLCAMLSDGRFAVLLPDADTVVFDDGQRLKLAASSTRRLEFFAAGSQFFILYANGQARSLFNSAEIWQSSPAWQHPWLGFTYESRFTANRNSILKVDAQGSALAEYSSNQNAVKIASLQRLPINPCEDEQVCGLSLAEDGSWLLSGYWGHYFGYGQRWQRLSLPLAIGQGAGGVAIAHSSVGGRFIYLGWDDGDTGVLPTIELNKTRSTNQPSQELWMVWHKQRPQLGLAFSQVMKSFTLRGSNSVRMQAWQGPLPEIIPADWLAWEAAQELKWTGPRNSNPESQPFWWAQNLGIEPAQKEAETQLGSPLEIRAAVVDSGIELDHPSLQYQLDKNPLEIAKNGIDDDGNGFIDDWIGYDFVDEDSDPNDEFGHGTHVAGLMAGAPTPSLSLRSPAPNLRLSVVRALDASGKSNSVDLARALLYARDQGAEIINCSWGGGADTQALRDAFAELKSAEIIVFSSAGNDKLNTDRNPEVPKLYPGVWSIGAIQENLGLSSFSNYGRQSVRWLAPGTAIQSAVLGGGLAAKSGTSMASPLAASAFAFIWGHVKKLYPNWDKLTQQQYVEALLCKTAATSLVEGRSSCGSMRLDRAVRELIRERP